MLSNSIIIFRSDIDTYTHINSNIWSQRLAHIYEEYVYRYHGRLRKRVIFGKANVDEGSLLVRALARHDLYLGLSSFPTVYMLVPDDKQRDARDEGEQLAKNMKEESDDDDDDDEGDGDSEGDDDSEGDGGVGNGDGVEEEKKDEKEEEEEEEQNDGDGDEDAVLFALRLFRAMKELKSHFTVYETKGTESMFSAPVTLSDIEKFVYSHLPDNDGHN